MDLMPFQPATWAQNRHVQTVLGELLNPRTPKVETERKVFVLSDGDRISYDVYRGDSQNVFVVGHGLTGSNKSRYVRSITYELNKRGHTVVAFNHRNCGDGFGLARQTYHSGRSEDIGELICFLRKVFPSRKLIAIGFSMSGNALLRLMGNLKHREVTHIDLPDAAIAVNAPVNIGKTSVALGQGLNRIYQVNFMKSFRKYTSRLHRRGLLDKSYEFSDYFTSMSEFDEIFTGPESGYGTADNYYRSCSALHDLNSISRQTFILTAEDDPFVDHNDFKVARDNPNIELHIEKYGGHMGYLSQKNLPHGTKRWMDYAILTMVDKILKGSSTVSD